MTPSFIVRFCLLAAIVYLQIGGCSNSSEESPVREPEHEMHGQSRLSIQSGDSLLFSSSEAMEEELSLPADMSDSMLVAYSFVEPSVPADKIASYERGSQIRVSLDESLTISARIDRNQPVADNMRSLTGTILAPYTGNLMLTVNQDMLTGAIDVMSANRLFYIRYDQETKNHYVAEIDRSKLDEQENAAPLELN